MRIIPVGKHVAIVDDEYYDLVSSYKWSPYKGGSNGDNCTFYAIANTPTVDGKRNTIVMHRLVMGAKKGVKVDHKDGDGLNNQKYNLRPATNRQNAQNRRIRYNQSSKFKGVSLNKRSSKWGSSIMVDGKSKWLGTFEEEELAARAYDEAARKHFGEFACLNFNET